MRNLARGDVVILSNRTSSTVKFSAATSTGAGKAFQLAAGDLMPVDCDARDQLRIAFYSEGERRDYQLHPNAIYYFHHPRETDALDLEEINIASASDNPPADVARPPGSPAARAAAEVGPPPLVTVKVKILVDDDEKAVRDVWEKRLRQRLANASALMEKYARVKLDVVACETWETPRGMREFEQQIDHFIRTVDPAPADVAIGFASQYTVLHGRTHLGGTRGPLSRHIMLREWAQHASEPERLELLIHELGHYFGATHSPEPNSVMRPILADRKSVSKGFRIVFDPINALAMNLVTEEMRTRKIERIYQISPRTREMLISIYLTMGKAFPDDAAAAQLLARLGEPPPAAARAKLTRASTLVESAREVRDSVVDLADRNHRLPRKATRPGQRVQLVGDELTEAYVQAAATAALEAPEALRTKAFSLGLAVALGDIDALKSNSLTRDLLPQIEGDADRERRLMVLGIPTIQGRQDFTRHFVLSVAIAAMTTSAISETAGLVKEMQDSQTASGFSFTDIGADLAGIALADYLRDSAGNLRRISESFSLHTFVPTITDLPDSLTREKFLSEYGSVSDKRFLAELDEIRARIRKLPIYGQADPVALPADKP